MLERTNIGELSVISNVTLLKIEISIGIAIDERNFFSHWLINFLGHAIFTREIWKKIWDAASQMNGFIIEAMITFCAGLFTQPPSSFSLRSCARRNLIYFTGTQSANFPRASPILCLVFEKVLALVHHDPYTYTKFVVAQALLLREDARAYFVGSGPRHYFEIHEVEWRNRVRVKFGIGRGKETTERWRSGPK